MSDYKIMVSETEQSKDSEELVRRLVQYNSSKIKSEDYKGLVITVRKKDGTLVAGLKGYTRWKWLFISHLWVDELLRKCGLGERILKAAEQEARNRDCLYSHLDTFDFQAPGFYKKLGYKKFGELCDYPPGHSRIYMHKTL